MSKEKISSGQIVKTSGIYNKLDEKGKSTGTQSTLVKGEPCPPGSYELDIATKHK